MCICSSCLSTRINNPEPQCGQYSTFVHVTQTGSIVFVCLSVRTLQLEQTQSFDIKYFHNLPYFEFDRRGFSLFQISFSGVLPQNTGCSGVFRGVLRLSFELQCISTDVSLLVVSVCVSRMCCCDRFIRQIRFESFPRRHQLKINWPVERRLELSSPTRRSHYFRSVDTHTQ